MIRKGREGKETRGEESGKQSRRKGKKREEGRGGEMMA